MDDRAWDKASLASFAPLTAVDEWITGRDLPDSACTEVAAYIPTITVAP